ncbi:8-amino-7-oxononanoate synthase [Pontibacter qinzhouensis]|uniref:8-amino-7-oxononanoate synthase n=1 Tax=Pontibacter qinzhouensis TaxID=2603253 RepID=A0A5C8K851_9BACT|nr:8-amino-7-oxononanoate synthase [Pontibacter qinzhouensis]TXK49221.1 8-amino-7-oxononanoate synthase [Pontibacter qinzhouensis]
MWKALEEKLAGKLAEREAQGNLRQLRFTGNLTDFCSNDYLGLARSENLKRLIQQESEKYWQLPIGATGSRLLSGNWPLMEELETEIARFHKAEAALLFNSGYSANVGLLSAVPQRGDTVFYDEASHASLKDGMRLSFAKSYSFRHNSLEDLRQKLQHASGQVFVVVESVYSMDGDQAPLVQLVELCQEFKAALVVDEAHAIGLYGPNGEGLVVELGMEKKVFARVLTYGKAMGCHGAAVVGPAVLRQFLVNYSRAFIYTTALPTHAVLALKGAYQLLPTLHQDREEVKQLSAYLFNQLNDIETISCTPQNSVILSVFVPDAQQLKPLALALQNQGYDIRPVMSPTVPKGSERLRLIVHSFNTQQEIDGLVGAIKRHT